MTTDLVHQNQAAYTLAEITSIGEVFAKSGYFKDATDMAKAVTKVLAGQELGLGPMTSMTGIHVVQGKPTLSASLVGALIKRSGRYDYRVKTLTDTECLLWFYERGEKVGESRFTLEDAKAAGLLGNQTWQKFVRNMLHSRALTNGARWYCPDVFGGAVYTPDEMGAVVDGETGEVVSVPEPEPAPEPTVVVPLATEDQVAEIGTLVDTLIVAGVFTDVKFRKAIKTDYGTDDILKLTEAQAAELLPRLQAKLPDPAPAEESQFKMPAGVTE
jgi:hypothetical protein